MKITLLEMFSDLEFNAEGICYITESSINNFQHLQDLARNGVFKKISLYEGLDKCIDHYGTLEDDTAIVSLYFNKFLDIHVLEIKNKVLMRV